MTPHEMRCIYPGYVEQEKELERRKVIDTVADGDTMGDEKNRPAADHHSEPALTQHPERRVDCGSG